MKVYQVKPSLGTGHYHLYPEAQEFENKEQYQNHLRDEFATLLDEVEHPLVAKVKGKIQGQEDGKLYVIAWDCWPGYEYEPVVIFE